MTREEAIKVIENRDSIYCERVQLREALDMAIEALSTIEQIRWERDIAIEQLKELGYELGEKIRTSEDAISRQDVIKILTKHGVHFCDMVKITSDLKDLPSIQPKPKMGHWEKHNDDHYDWVECPECGYGAEGEITSEDGVRFNFCPNCGTKMSESEE